MTSKPGHISTEHTVWCGVRLSLMGENPIKPSWYDGYYCLDHYQFSDKPVVVHITRMGWRKLGKYGWVCNNCYTSCLAWLDKGEM